MSEARRSKRVFTLEIADLSKVNCVLAARCEEGFSFSIRIAI
jgi:hypothetical protein